MLFILLLWITTGFGIFCNGFLGTKQNIIGNRIIKSKFVAKLTNDEFDRIYKWKTAEDFLKEAELLKKEVSNLETNVNKQRNNTFQGSEFIAQTDLKPYMKLKDNNQSSSIISAPIKIPKPPVVGRANESAEKSLESLSNSISDISNVSSKYSIEPVDYNSIDLKKMESRLPSVEEMLKEALPGFSWAVQILTYVISEKVADKEINFLANYAYASMFQYFMTNLNSMSTILPNFNIINVTSEFLEKLGEEDKQFSDLIFLFDGLKWKLYRIVDANVFDNKTFIAASKFAQRSEMISGIINDETMLASMRQIEPKLFTNLSSIITKSQRLSNEVMKRFNCVDDALKREYIEKLKLQSTQLYELSLKGLKTNQSLFPLATNRTMGSRLIYSNISSLFQYDDSFQDDEGLNIDPYPEFKSNAERLVYECFDGNSRLKGDRITRDGAQQFIEEVLQDIFRVKKIVFVDGAYILKGSESAYLKNSLAMAISGRLSNHSLNDYLEYSVVTDEQLDMDDSLTSMAFEMMSRSSVVVIYPKTWKLLSQSLSTQRFTRNFVTYTNILSVIMTVAVSFGYVNMDILSDPMSALSFASRNPESFLNVISIAAGSLTVSLLSYASEWLIARFKQIQIGGNLIPSFTIPNFGYQARIQSIAKNRNDLFDVAAVGVGVSFVLSSLALYFGISLTVQASIDDIKSYPAIPIAFIQLSTYLIEIFSSSFGNMKDVVTRFPAEGTIHLHWLAIVGIVSFLTSILRLFPFDNNSGYRMIKTLIGNGFVGVTAKFSFEMFRFILLLVTLFTQQDSNDGVISKTLFDFSFWSLLSAGVEGETLAKDNVTELSEVRKLVLAIFVLVVGLSFAPYGLLHLNFVDATENLFAFLSRSASTLDNISKGKVPDF